jgi:hypothetical protein
MKKFVLLFAALVGLSLAAAAQPKALGIRGGLFGNAFNGEISYEHWLTIFDNDYDFLEAELGVFGGNGFKGTAMYNFTFAQPEFTDRGEWGFYAGPGIVAGYGTGVNKNDEKVAAPFVGLAAQLGMEYTFWFPLQVSVDFRPAFMIPTLMNRSNWYGFALSARYAF